MLYFSKDAPRLAFATPSVQLAALGVALFLSGLGAQGLSPCSRIHSAQLA